MSISEQQFKEICDKIISEASKKGSITSDELIDKMDKFKISPEQMELVYDALKENNITVVDSVELENRGNGVFRLDKTGMADGEYTVHLKMYDKAGNEGEHYFYQTLDNTAPTLTFVTPEQNSNATYYSTWMNVSKSIIINITDKNFAFMCKDIFIQKWLFVI